MQTEKTAAAQHHYHQWKTFAGGANVV